jgi:hypothetical protein
MIQRGRRRAGETGDRHCKMFCLYPQRTTITCGGLFSAARANALLFACSWSMGMWFASLCLQQVHRRSWIRVPRAPPVSGHEPSQWYPDSLPWRSTSSWLRGQFGLAQRGAVNVNPWFAPGGEKRHGPPIHEERRPAKVLGIALWPVSDRATPPTAGLPNKRRPAVGAVGGSGGVRRLAPSLAFWRVVARKANRGNRAEEPAVGGRS